MEEIEKQIKEQGFYSETETIIEGKKLDKPLTMKEFVKEVFMKSNA